jgi:tRNA threonylcarbamoyladenosine biosynthesis protein TsaE
VLELGFEEMAKGILLVEWPERLGRLLPQKRFEVWLSYGTSEVERTLRLCCPTGRSLEVKL